MMCERCEEINQIKKDRAFNLERGLVAGARVDHQYAAGSNTVSTQYTPMLVQTMFELYQYPEKRAELLRYQDRTESMAGVFNLLQRAKIISPAPNGYSVDDDALRTYVNAVCNVPLPTQTWVMR